MRNYQRRNQFLVESASEVLLTSLWSVHLFLYIQRKRTQRRSMRSSLSRGKAYRCWSSSLTISLLMSIMSMGLWVSQYSSMYFLFTKNRMQFTKQYSTRFSAYEPSMTLRNWLAISWQLSCPSLNSKVSWQSTSLLRRAFQSYSTQSQLAIEGSSSLFWVRNRYVGGQTGSASRLVGFWFYEGARRFAVVLLLDVGEEGGVGKVPLAAGTPEFPLCFLLLGSLNQILGAFLLAHKIICINSNQPSRHRPSPPAINNQTQHIYRLSPFSFLCDKIQGGEVSSPEDVTQLF